MSRSTEKLREYEDKRDFAKSPEPDDEDVDFDWAEHPVFIIQKHDASSLHYDFRLEVDGVLKSWAVPKGPSTDPREKHLAIQTEDHPLSYAEFEGTIPEDEYGGGTVLLWDRGSYRNLKEEEEEEEEDDKDKEKPPSVAEQIEDGHVTVWLEGKKIAGGYALIHMDGSDDDQWLLIKMDDEEADARRNPTSTEPKSVKTGRTLDDISEDAKGSS